MEERNALLERNVGENLDAIVSLDIRGYGVPGTLYQAARSQADGPLIMGAAAALRSVVQPGNAVVIATGFIFPPWNTGELDGVVGASVVARALEIGFGAKPVLVAEPELVGALIKLVRIAGLQPTENISDFLSRPHTALVLGFPKDEVSAREESTRILESVSPKAMISIERPGRSEGGAYHMGNGAPVTELAAKVDILFEDVAQRGALTVAIGDLGNELGLGSLQEAVRAGIPYGDKIAAEVPAERVITAAVSDWAGYALAAAIGFQSSNEEACIPADLLGRLLTGAVDAGLIDGSGYAIPSVDGVGLDYNMGLANLLRDVTTMPKRTQGRFEKMFDMKLDLDR